MKRTIIFFVGIILTYMIIGNVFAESNIIPDDAIRIRVVPNSNLDYDQEIKGKVKNSLEISMYDLLKDVKDSDEARKVIKENLNTVDKNIYNLLEKEKYDKGYKINFGYNYFPEKKYKGIKYDEGYYESLLVTLGEGKGDNWWCVLFPPLCLIEAEENSDTEYKSLVKELIDKYL